MLSWNGPKMDKRKQRQRKSCVVIEESPSSEILLNKAEVWIRLSSANKLATVENLTDWRQWRFPNLDNMIYEETFPHVQTWFAFWRYKRLITEDIREREQGKLNLCRLLPIIGMSEQHERTSILYSNGRKFTNLATVMGHDWVERGETIKNFPFINFYFFIFLYF